MFSFTEAAFGFLTIVLFVALVDFVYKRYFIWKYGRNIMFIPYLPIVGSTFLAFNKNILELFEEWSGRIKTSCYFFIFHTPTLFTIDPNVIRVVLTHPKAVNKSYVYRFLEPVVKDAIAIADEKIWRPNRKILVKALGQKQLDQYQALFNRLPDGLMDYLGESDTKSFKEVNEAAEKILLDVFLAGLCKFDHQYSKADMTNYANLDMYGTVKSVYYETLERFLKPWLYPDIVYFNTSRGKKYNRQHKTLDETFKQIFSERRAILDECKKGFYDKNEVTNMIDVMLENGLETDHMIGELKFQAVAASDTSALTMTLLLIILGFHPDVQEKIFTEVTEVLGSHESLEPSHLIELKYTEMCLMETWRLFPPIPIIGRQSSEDLEIDGMIIPKNTDILIGLMQVHRNEKYWPDPLKFKPERFTAQEIKDRDPFCYIPFAAGQRNCIGGRYATCVLKTAIAKIIRKYRVKTSLTSIEEIKVKSNISLFMTDDIRCTFIKRKKYLNIQ